MSDYVIQVNTIVDDSLIKIKKRFPDIQNTSGYTLRLRGFVQNLEILLAKALVVEHASFDSPQQISLESYNNGKKLNYPNEIALFDELRKKNFIRDVESKLEESIKLSNKYSIDSLKSNHSGWQNLMSKEFLKYYVNDNICDIVNAFEYKYKTIFSKFDKEDLNDQIKGRLMLTFERRIRAGVISKYMKENYKEYLSYFDNSILKAKLFAVIKWGEDENKHKDWLEEYLSSKFEDFHKHPYIFKKLEGNERIIVTEIVPKNLEDYSGEIGGKTIKLTSFSNLYAEFNLTEALEVLEKTDNPKLLKKLRTSFLKTIIARRYIFREAIDKIIEFNNGSARISSDKISLDDNDFRARAYISFFNKSEKLLNKLYAKIKV